MERAAAVAAAEMLAGKVADSAHDPCSNQGLCDHRAACMPHVHAQAGHMKESIFCDTFRNAMAHRNQIRTLPDTASRPAASTWACASLSEKAKAVWQDRQRRSAIRKAAVSTFLYFFMVIVIPFYFSHSESGFAMNAPTMLVNSRRHQAFMSRRNTCPPNIRHQDLKMLEVDWDAPMENATGAV